MKKIALMVTIVSLLSTQSVNAMGLFSTHTTHPITATCAVNRRDVCCLRCGQASSTNILWLVEFGDSGIHAAAKDGCIRQIHHVDQTVSTFLLLFRRETTTVYGE